MLQLRVTRNLRRSQILTNTPGALDKTAAVWQSLRRRSFSSSFFDQPAISASINGIRHGATLKLKKGSDRSSQPSSIDEALAQTQRFRRDFAVAESIKGNVPSSQNDAESFLAGFGDVAQAPTHFGLGIGEKVESLLQPSFNRAPRKLERYQKQQLTDAEAKELLQSSSSWAHGRRKNVVRTTNYYRSQTTHGGRSRFSSVTISQRTHMLEPMPVVEQKKVQVTARQTLSYLGRQMGVKVSELQGKLALLGEKPRTGSQFISGDLAEILIHEFKMKPIRVASADIIAPPPAQDYSSLPVRPPVVCVMGHVDHGKTTLLDALRKTSIAAREAGGITQSIGGFTVPLSDGNFITFLDTPGHAAFRSMRVKGANPGLTDIIVLVVSVHDGVQPQTIEAIRLAQHHNVPLVVAINKCDVPGGDPQKIREELKQYGVVTEDQGGDTFAVEISALKRTKLDDLAAAITLTADMLELRAARDGLAQCFVVESHIERGKGCVVNAIVRTGTLKVGDYVVSGTVWAKIRAMFGDQGKPLEQALPSTAVSIMGFEKIEGLQAELQVVESEERAQEIVKARLSAIEDDETVADLEQKWEQETTDASGKDRSKPLLGRNAKMRALRKRLGEEFAAAQSKVAAEKQADKEAEDRTVQAVLKSDVSGSLQVMLDYVKQLPSDDVQVQVLRSGLGEVTESDVDYAAKFKAAIFGFNVKANAAAVARARQLQVPLSVQRVIYSLMDDMKEQLQARMPIVTETTVSGVAEVMQLFPLSKGKKTLMCAGCKITRGELHSEDTYRLLRSGEELWTGKLRSMRHLKEDVKTLERSQEGGLVLDGFNELQIGDQLECIHTETKRKPFDDSLARDFKKLDLFDQIAKNEATTATITNIVKSTATAAAKETPQAATATSSATVSAAPSVTVAAAAPPAPETAAKSATPAPPSEKEKRKQTRLELLNSMAEEDEPSTSLAESVEHRPVGQQYYS